MKKFILLLLLPLLSCEMQKESADLIFLNANIHTVDPDFSSASAFAVRDGIFLDVGSNSDIQQKYSSDQIIDAGGKTIVPGLIDAHCHFYELGMTQQLVDLNGTKSFDEILERIQVFYEENQPAIIRGRGWDQNDWEVKEYPEKDILDELYPEIPVVLERVDGHALLVNQLVLDMAGIDKNTVVAGGEIVKKQGMPTGILIDSPMAMVATALPAADKETMIRALKDAEQICFSNGLTTVNDAGLDREVISLIDSLQQVGELSIRVYAMISNTKENLDHYLSGGIIKKERLNIRSVKVYADGALGSRGAALKKPYSDHDGHFGAMITPADEMEDLALLLAASEFQMNTHAIGDSANVVVLRAYEKALAGDEDRRWKVEHAQVLDPADFPMFGKGVLPSVQPTHATSDMYWAEDRLGPDRVQGAYAFKTLLNQAGMIALGTDFPVEAVSPFYTFYAAVARKDLDHYPEGGFMMQEALTREEALKGMTIWPAYSNFEEDEKGSIEAGKLADFVILDRDLMTVPEDELPEVKAEKTYVGGKPVE